MEIGCHFNCLTLKHDVARKKSNMNNIGADFKDAFCMFRTVHLTKCWLNGWGPLANMFTNFSFIFPSLKTKLAVVFFSHCWLHST